MSADSLATIGRLVRADLTKLSCYWIVVAGYAAISLFLVFGAILTHFAEQSFKVTSASGYGFAFSLMVRGLDFSSSILYVMICILFSIDVAHSTVKYVLTRPVTRLELLLSKYVTAAIMIAATLALLWGTSLGAAWIYYGLGDLTENDYVIFEAGTVFHHIAVATCFLALAMGATASMAIAISSFSSTMGGSIVIGFIFYTVFGALSVIPADLGVSFDWGQTPIHLPYSILAFPTQIFVPMYILDDLPTGIAIQDWWGPDIRRMCAASVTFGLVFFAIAAMGVRKRDYTL
ncbi:ABC transporter permease [Myxococcota bacterium]|nr:ABC transporter permease [Myxococcota bacterium]